MFTVDYNSQNPEANILVKQQDIFQNTLTIKSIHCYYGTVSCYKYTAKREDLYGKKVYSTELGCKNGSVCCSPHRDVPIDIVYKSTPQGEKIFITLWGNPTSSRLIFNIDGKSNIDLIRYDDIRDNFGHREWSSEANDAAIGEQRYEEEGQRFYQQRGPGFDRLYFEITKEQLEKMCSATTLYIQTSSHNNDVQFEGDASGFIIILKALYNEAIDNTMYTDATDIAFSLLETAAANIQANNDIEVSKKTKFDNRRENTTWVLLALLVIGVIGFFIWLITSANKMSM